MFECDNVAHCHNLIDIAQDDNAMRVICTNCWNQYVIHKHPIKGNPEMRHYAEIFKKDILQPNDNLFYKYYTQYLKT
jgi:hypothetical protein